jgi:hypothetical protein
LKKVTMGLSIRAYARHRGVSHVAVKKAIDTGRITALPDGTIDPDAADAQWAQNTLQPRRAAAQEKVSTAKARRAPATAEAHRSARPRPSTRRCQQVARRLLQARTVNEVLKAKLNKVELAHRKKELVDRAQAVAHVFKLARIRARCVAELARAHLGADGLRARRRRAHDARRAGSCRARAPEELGELRPRVD